MIFALVVLFLLCSLVAAVITENIYSTIYDQYYKQVETYKVKTYHK